MEPDETQETEYPTTWSLKNPAFRRWLYRVLFAAFALAVLYGWISADQVDGWLLLVAGVLGLGGTGLAERNVP